MMSAGDFQTPFLLMATAYLIGTFLFWQFFSGKEQELSLTPVALTDA